MLLPRGVNYVPARAFNAYQFWRLYDRDLTARDLTFATQLSFNALRLPLSYESWLQNPDRLAQNFTHLLAVAREKELAVLPVLFDCLGLDPTPATKADMDPLTGSALRSPHPGIIADASKWKYPLEFLDWFLTRYGAGDRLLAIDLVNQPATPADLRFARHLLARCRAKSPAIPLTLGTSRLADAIYFLDLGLDALSFHLDHPAADADARAAIDRAATTQSVVEKPVWVAQWQGADAGDPAYATLCPLLGGSPLGHFASSLMLKPAPLLPDRTRAVLTGIFHEDGAVYCLDDARALSRNPVLDLPQRRAWPAWAAGVPVTYSRPAK